MTGWAWGFFALSCVSMVLNVYLLLAAVRLAAEVTHHQRQFKEQEREHIREIQHLVNQYPPPKGDIAP